MTNDYIEILKRLLNERIVIWVLELLTILEWHQMKISRWVAIWYLIRRALEANCGKWRGNRGTSLLRRPQYLTPSRSCRVQAWLIFRRGCFPKWNVIKYWKKCMNVKEMLETIGKSRKLNRIEENPRRKIEPRAHIYIYIYIHTHISCMYVYIYINIYIYHLYIYIYILTLQHPLMPDRTC